MAILDQSFAAAPAIVGRKVAGEFVLVPVVRHAADIRSIFVLNEVGSTVWNALKKPSTGHEIVGRVAQEFDASKDDIAADVESFLIELKEAGLVTAKEVSP